MSITNYTVSYDPIKDYAEIIEETYIPNETPEGALEFFLADKGITPESGDDAIIYPTGKSLTKHTYVGWDENEETGELERRVS